MDKLSHEEHRARALLLGRIYDWRDGTYCLRAGDCTETLLPQNMMDCETLEVFAHYPMGRLLEPAKNNRWFETPTIDGPWVRKDEE